MRTRELLTYEERKIIQDLHEWKLSPSKIAKKINRTRRCVLMEILKNTIDGPYDAEKAHNAAYVHRKEVSKNVYKSKKFEEISEKEKFIERISALEMQMEIIVDQLKELYERNSKNN